VSRSAITSILKTTAARNSSVRLLRLDDLDLTLLGFGEDEVKELLRSLEVRERREHVESFDLDEALEEARRAPRTKLGHL
jgi:hypothetical protein